MPILDIEIVTASPPEESLAAALADMAGEVFNAPSGTTWVRLRTLPPQQYAENQARSPAAGPVFVTVLQFRRPGAESQALSARALSEGVARLCGRDVQNVHVLYEPDAAGRIAFGGTLRE